MRVLYNKNDLRYVFFVGPQEEFQSTRAKAKEKRRDNLEDFLNIIPTYQFLPSFKGTPRPEVFLHKFKNKEGKIIYYAHSGLWKTVADWCKEKSINFDFDDADYFKYTGFKLSLDEFKEHVKGWGLTLTPYEYQLKAAWLILHYRQSLSQLATRAGKTLIAYMVFRYMLEHGAKKILMVVPNTTLVKQAVQDFRDYKEFFDSETVWAKGEMIEGSNLTVGTFQSLVKKCDKKSVKYDPKFFNDYDVVLVDEAHTLKCESINAILNQEFMKNVKLKFGFSGSLPKERTIDSFCCHALMGPTIQDIRSKELMDGGFITPIDITQIRIEHPMNEDLKDAYIKCGEYINSNAELESKLNEKGKRVVTHKLLPSESREFTLVEQRKLPLNLRGLKGMYDKDEYISYLVDLCKANGSNLLLLEQMLVHRDKKRLDVMEGILKGMKKNCIVYFHHIEYGKFLKKYFEEKFPDRNVYLIQGSTTQKQRDKIIKSLLIDKDAILFASYGCCSTGITFKNLDYGILAQSFKSQIITLQSLGRGLCLANDKEKFYLYDLVDCFPTGNLQRQGTAKCQIYREQKFDFRVVTK